MPVRIQIPSPLALVHVPRLEPVLAEFAHVLRPGGDLVISDLHHELVTRGSVITARGPAGEPCIVATYRHQRSTLTVIFHGKTRHLSGGWEQSELDPSPHHLGP